MDSSSYGRKFVLVNFGQGKLSEESKRNINVEFEEDQNGNVVPIARTSKLRYSGIKLESSTNSHLLICLWNKKTNRTEMEEVEVYSMVPDIADFSSNTEKTIKNTNSLEKHFDIVEQFGSTKMKSAIRSTQKKLQGAKIIGEKVSDTIQTHINKESIDEMIKIKQELSEITDNKTFCLPPTDEVTKLYEMEAIMPEKVYTILSENSESFVQWLQSSYNYDETRVQLPEFMIYCYLNCNLLPESEKITEQIHSPSTILLFWYYLYQFYSVLKSNNNALKIKSALPEVPSVLRRHFVKTFLDEEDNSFSMKKVRIKCLCYLLVISFYIFNWGKISLTPLFSDLKITPAKLRVYLKLIGCKDIQDNEASMSSSSGNTSCLTTKNSSKRKMSFTADSPIKNLLQPKKNKQYFD